VSERKKKEKGKSKSKSKSCKLIELWHKKEPTTSNPNFRDLLPPMCILYSCLLLFRFSCYIRSNHLVNLIIASHIIQYNRDIQLRFVLSLIFFWIALHRNAKVFTLFASYYCSVYSFQKLISIWRDTIPKKISLRFSYLCHFQ
jgi:hypothetical protein